MIPSCYIKIVSWPSVATIPDACLAQICSLIFGMLVSRSHVMQQEQVDWHMHVADCIMYTN